MTQPWDPDFAARSPMFEPLRAHAAGFPASWPEPADLQCLLEKRSPPVRTASGMPVRVVAQGPKPACQEDRYEARIYLQAENSVAWFLPLALLAYMA